MNRRGQIAMSDGEAVAFLAQQRTVVCATAGPRGWPHLTALWYVPRGLELWCWTYGASQKTRNLKRDPRATLQVEAGETYGELRGVMIEAEATVHRDPETKLRVARELAERYGGGSESISESQVEKRVAIAFAPRRVISWDHRKL